jgi:hypothetical protein
MQFSSLPINSSLQNNPRYQFSLKSESIEIFADFVGGHFENKNDPECNFHPNLIILIIDMIIINGNIQNIQ